MALLCKAVVCVLLALEALLTMHYFVQEGMTEVLHEGIAHQQPTAFFPGNTPLLADVRVPICEYSSHVAPSRIIMDLHAANRLSSLNPAFSMLPSMSMASFLHGDTGVRAELSDSPLVLAINTRMRSSNDRSPASVDANTLYAAQVGAHQRHVQTVLNGTHHCRSKVHPPGRSVVYVLSAVRDEPKRALEFVAYHLTLGATKIVLLDCGVAQFPGKKPISDDLLLMSSPRNDSFPRGYHGLPDLESYLRPFVEEGLVQVVRAVEVDPRRASAPDDADAERLRSSFFYIQSRALARKDPNAVFLLTKDVSDYLLVTVPLVERRAAASSRHEYMCLADVASRWHLTVRRAGLLIPKSELRPPSFLYDSGAPLFQHASFAVGSPKRLMRAIVDAVATPRYRGRSGFDIKDVSCIVSGSALLRASARLSKTFTLPSGATFVDGSTNLACLRTNASCSIRFMQQPSISFSLRMVRFAPSLGATLVNTINHCLANILDDKQVAPAMMKVFDVSFAMTLHSQRPLNFKHFLPGEHSLGRCGFAGLMNEFYRLLQLPSVMDVPVTIEDNRVLVCSADDSQQQSLVGSSGVVEALQSHLRLVSTGPSLDRPLAVGMMPQRPEDWRSEGSMMTFSNDALLNFALQLLPEESASPLVSPLLTHTKSQRNERMNFIMNSVSQSQCRRDVAERSPPARRVIVLTAARDEPKRALEFVAYHLLLGAHKVVVLDLGTDSQHRVPSNVEDDHKSSRHKFRTPKRPPLQHYLRPFVDAQFVDIISLPQFGEMTGAFDDKLLSTCEIPDPYNKAPYTAKFFAAYAKQLSALEPEAFVLMLEDVNDFLVMTSEVRRSNITTEGEEQASYPCIHDFIPAADVSDEALTKIRLLPKVEVRPPSFVCDTSRTPFELTSFATGNTTQLLALFGERVETLRRDCPMPHRGGGGDSSGGNNGCWDPAAPLLPPLFAATKSFTDGNFDRSAVAFPDGSVIPADVVDISSDGVKSLMTMRVVRIMPSLQRTIEMELDACHVEPPRSGQRKSFDVRKFGFQNAVNFMDDLSNGHRLRFLRLHADLLRVLQFPLQLPRQQSASPSPVSLEVQLMLYRHDLVLDSRTRMPLQDLVDVTNEHFALGEIILRTEEHPSDLGQLFQVLPSKLARYFRSGSFGASECPRNPSRKNKRQTSRWKGLTGGGAQKDEESSSAELSVNVTLCAFVKANRTKGVLEWALYHKALGVGRFVLIVDGNADESARAMENVLRPLVDLGFVTIVAGGDRVRYRRFKDRIVASETVAAFDVCLSHEVERAKVEQHSEAPWVGLFDTSEYLVLSDDRSSKGCLPQLLSNMKSTAHSDVSFVAFPLRASRPLERDVFDASASPFHRVDFDCGDEKDVLEGVRWIARSDSVKAMSNAQRIVPTTNNFSMPHVVLPTAMMHGSLDEVIESSPSVFHSSTHAAGWITSFRFGTLTTWLQDALDSLDATSATLNPPLNVDRLVTEWRSQAKKKIRSEGGGCDIRLVLGFAWHVFEDLLALM